MQSEAFSTFVLKNIRELVSELRKVSIFSNNVPIIHRACEMEQEVYRQANLLCQERETFDVWEKQITLARYQEGMKKMIEGVKSEKENTVFWDRVEAGSISDTNIVKKFCGFELPKVIPSLVKNAEFDNKINKKRKRTVS